MSGSTGTGDTDPTPPTQPQGKGILKVLNDNKQLGVGGILLALLSTGVVVSRDDLAGVEKDMSTLSQKVAILAANQQSLINDLKRAGEDSRQSEQEFERIKELVFRQAGREDKSP